MMVNYWTPIDDHLLSQMAGKYTISDIGEKLGGRTCNAVIHRAFVLRISLAIERKFRKWGDEDKKWLTELWTTELSIKDIANRMNRDYHSVRAMIDRLELSRYKAWTNHEEKYLIGMAKTFFNSKKRTKLLDEMSVHLKRSRLSVSGKMYLMRRKGIV